MNRTQTTLRPRTTPPATAAAKVPPAGRRAARTVAKTVSARARDTAKRRGTVEDRMKALQARENTARLWKAILSQDEHWVPKGAWPKFGEASLRAGGLLVVPDFTVEGVIKVADMDAEYRKATVAFIWRKSKGIASAIAWSTLYGGSGSSYDHGRHDFDDEMNLFKLTKDDNARREWFNAMPLIATMNAGIVAERDARIERPVDLSALWDAFFPPQKTTDSGILLP